MPDNQNPLPQLPMLQLGGGLPASLGMLFGGQQPSALLQSLFRDMNSSFDEGTQRANDLAGMANQFGQQYGQLLQQPWPQTSNLGDFAARLAGNVSQAIAPQMNGQAQAEQTIQHGQQLATNSRVMRLQMLRDNYDKMAQAAMEAGNTLQHTKMLEKSNMLDKQLSEEQQNTRTAAEIKAQRDIAAAAQAGETKRTQMTIDSHLVDTLLSRGAALRENGNPKNPNDYLQSAAIMSKIQFAQTERQALAPIFGKGASQISYEDATSVNNYTRSLYLSTKLADEVKDPYRWASRVLGKMAPAPTQAQFEIGPSRTGYGKRTFGRLINTVGDYRQLRESLQAQFSDQLLRDTQLNTVLIRAGVQPELIKYLEMHTDEPITRQLDDILNTNKYQASKQK